MLLLVAGPQARVVAFLRDAGMRGAVGPTSPAGWTAAWVVDEAIEHAVRPVESHVAFEETRAGAVLAVHTADGDLLVELASVDETRAAGAVDALVTLFGTRNAASRAALLDALLDADVDLDQFLEELEGSLDMPPLEPLGVELSLVVTRCEPPLVRAAARAAGPVRMAPVGSGWTLLSATDGKHDLTGLAQVLAREGRRGEPTVALWRAADRMGFAVATRESESSWTWGDPWQYVELGEDDAESVVGAIHSVRLLDDAERSDDSTRLRDLLHRPGPDPLNDLVEAAGLPPAVSMLLRHPEFTLPGEERIQPASWRRTLAEMVLEGWRDPLPLQRRHRFIYATFTVGTLVAAIVMAAMSALAWAVVASDGAVAGQEGTGAEDWAYGVIATAMALVLAVAFVYRLRRIRGRRRLRGPRPRRDSE